MKLSSTTLAVALAMALSSTAADAFVPAAPAVGNSISSSNKVSSPTEMHMVGGIKDLFNDGKKKVVKVIAGDYDKVAIKARVDGLIADSPVLMFSFTTWPFCIK